MNSCDLKQGPLSDSTLMGNPNSLEIPFNAFNTHLLDSFGKILITGNHNVMSTNSKNEWSSKLKRSISSSIHGTKGIFLVNTGSLGFSP